MIPAPNNRRAVHRPCTGRDESTATQAVVSHKKGSDLKPVHALNNENTAHFTVLEQWSCTSLPVSQWSLRKTIVASETGRLQPTGNWMVAHGCARKAATTFE